MTKSYIPPHMSGKKIEKYAKRREVRVKKIKLKIVLMQLAIITTLCAVWLLNSVLSHWLDLWAAQREMAQLQKLNPISKELLEINPDYTGWLVINGTNISYPVVRGSDNVKYLDTSFRGEKNSLGAIFMDYRLTNDSQHIIIYGHNSGDTDGNFFMFGSLCSFLDEQFREEHPEIILVDNNIAYGYEIFSVRETDVFDPAYQVDFSEFGTFENFLIKNGAPSDATKIITLSTCIGDGSNDLRLVVQGAYKRTAIVDNIGHNENGGWHINMQE